MKNLTVIRKEFNGKDDKKYWSYMVKGQVRWRDVKVDFVPKDIGGYEPLDIVFDVANTAELIISNEYSTDTAGNKINYTVYKVRNIDELGIEYECDVKPQRNSDKSLLLMLLNVLRAEEKAEQEKQANEQNKTDKKVKAV